MITFETIENGNSWTGVEWNIEDEDELAKLLARVAMGQYRHVLKVLVGTNCIEYAPTKSIIDGAIQLLTAKNPDEPWHRDGWLFQVISWFAANIQNPQTLKSAPHMIHAHKGFDGVHIILDKNNENVAAVVICEEKATGNPRNKITSQVWPEFISLETGSRDNELVSEITALLEKNGHIDPDEAVHKIFWEKARAYRVSITVGDKENSEKGRKALFKGYETAAPGKNVEKRRAEIFYQKNIREWMSDISAKAIAAAEQLDLKDV